MHSTQNILILKIMNSTQNIRILKIMRLMQNIRILKIMHSTQNNQILKIMPMDSQLTRLHLHFASTQSSQIILQCVLGNREYPSITSRPSNLTCVLFLRVHRKAVWRTSKYPVAVKSAFYFISKSNCKNYEVWIALKIVAQTGSKLHLGPDPSCINLDPDPSSVNLGLGTYCTLPSKILYNPNTHIAYLPLLGDVKTIKMIVLRSEILAALVHSQFVVDGCGTRAGDKQLVVATVAAVLVVHVMGAFFNVVVAVVCACLILGFWRHSL
jgi:hypothetical protein